MFKINEVAFDENLYRKNVLQNEFADDADEGIGEDHGNNES